MKGDHIQYKEGYKYQLASDYWLLTDIRPKKDIKTEYISLTVNGLLIIRAGYAWDGASGPTFDTKSSMRGSLAHDALYQLMRLGLLDESFREQADELLQQVCIEDGMLPFRAYVWEKAVRWFAAGCAKAGTERPVLIAP